MDGKPDKTNKILIGEEIISKVISRWKPIIINIVYEEDVRSCFWHSIWIDYACLVLWSFVELRRLPDKLHLLSNIWYFLICFHKILTAYIDLTSTIYCKTNNMLQTSNLITKLGSDGMYMICQLFDAISPPILWAWTN